MLALLFLLCLAPEDAPARGPASAVFNVAGIGASRLLSDRGVQAEIGLTDDQRSRAEALERGLSAGFREKVKALSNLPAGEGQDRTRELYLEFEEALVAGLSKILSPEQEARFGEIRLQQMDSSRFTHDRSLMASVGINPGQVETIAAINRAMDEKDRRPSAGGARSPVSPSLDSIRERREKVVGVLTDDQVQRILKRKGKPFRLQVDTSNP